MNVLMRYIPEATPVIGEIGGWRFEQVLQELERTQEQLGAILPEIISSLRYTIRYF